jgi:dolichol-phosphate mannosyltransferase
MTPRHSYSLHGLVTIRSERALPELEYFKSTTVGDAVDIDVVIAARPPARVGPGSIRYAELFGQLGFTVAIDRDASCAHVVASPLVGASPHVLYTNVVEPILRWSLVRRGHALMHGACLARDGRALFITALTDTGKTTTVLYALQDDGDGWGFLADDMTIVSPSGRVKSFPKPLTISLHTLRAVDHAPLTSWERLALQVQSRLHSRAGRGAGMWLSARKAPAATLNALVQMVIPPPKYMVDRLIPDVRYETDASLAAIVLIERGPALEEPLDEAEAADIMLVNADDAYGFPPYPTLAPFLRVWEGEDLRQREREIVAAETRGVPGMRLRRSDRAWHEGLARLLEVPAQAPSGASHAADAGVGAQHVIGG